MHVFVSDLHMDDTGASGSVSDVTLTKFIARLETLAVEHKQKIKLVFLGDVLELLRSPSWETLWNNHKSTPWSGMGPDFRNFRDGHAEKTAIEIARAICTRYPNFSGKLKSLVQHGTIETKYIFGNHDYMVQLSQGLRQILVEFLSLSHDPAKPFQLSYSDKAASVFATHGHGVDAVNWHRKAEGYWALGDAVVLRVVNRFATVACERLGLALSTETGRLLQELDNIEPISDIPVYVRWLAEKSLAIKKQRKDIEKAWKDVVDDFLAIPEFDDARAYGATPYKMLRRAFEFSTRMGLAEMAANLPELFEGTGVDYRGAALRESEQHTQYRFVLFGHTHGPMFVPLTSDGNRGTFYVNTGCWRRVVTRPSVKARGPFLPRRLATYFVVDDDDRSATQERYHFHQEWHAT
jgi:UDP-2,3-diacylglucosamine pyrophosphatase LpxH